MRENPVPYIVGIPCAALLAGMTRHLSATTAVDRTYEGTRLRLRTGYVYRDALAGHLSPVCPKRLTLNYAVGGSMIIGAGPMVFGSA